MQRIRGIRIFAPRQVPVPRKKKHLRQMPNPLLPPRHERKSQAGHAIFRSKNATASPELGAPSRLGQPPKTPKTGKKNKLVIPFLFSHSRGKGQLTSLAHRRSFGFHLISPWDKLFQALLISSSLVH